MRRFSSETEKDIFDEILKGHIDFKSLPWPSISTGAKDIIRKMLTMDPRKRITAAQAIGKYITKGRKYQYSIPPTSIHCPSWIGHRD